MDDTQFPRTSLWKIPVVWGGIGAFVGLIFALLCALGDLMAVVAGGLGSCTGMAFLLYLVLRAHGSLSPLAILSFVKVAVFFLAFGFFFGGISFSVALLAKEEPSAIGPILAGVGIWCFLGTYGGFIYALIRRAREKRAIRRMRRTRDVYEDVRSDRSRSRSRWD
jgi:hypothetical protein